MKKATTSRKKAATTPAKKSPPNMEKAAASAPPLVDWRDEVIARVRTLIQQADPDVVEEVKWRKPSNGMRGVPVWEHGGIICTGETYKDYVKLTFAKGASLADPSGLFNASLEGNARRAIDIREGDKIDDKAFKALIRGTVKLNVSPGKDTGAKKPDAKKTAAERTAPKQSAAKTANAKPVLLSGGNPQIAKAYGDEPVQAYIAAMPGWKQGVGRMLDTLITRAVPNVYKAVKWNTPFYGIEGEGWFLGFHCMTKYIKVAFFRGTSLSPVPPEKSKQKEVRYFHIHEDELAGFDEAQFVSWVKQASKLPGEKM